MGDREVTIKEHNTSCCFDCFVVAFEFQQQDGVQEPKLNGNRMSPNRFTATLLGFFGIGNGKFADFNGVCCWIAEEPDRLACALPWPAASLSIRPGELLRYCGAIGPKVPTRCSIRSWWGRADGLIPRHSEACETLESFDWKAEFGNAVPPVAV